MKKKELNLRPWMLALLVLLLSGMALGVAMFIQPGSLFQTLRYFLQTPLLLLLNYLPMVLLTLLLWGILGDLFAGAGLTTLIWGALSYINLVKVQARGDPFVPGDVLLVFEGMQAVGSYQLQLHPGKLLLMAAVCAALFAAGRFFVLPAPKLRTRVITAVSAAAVFVAAMAGLYCNNTLYQALPGPDRSNVPLVYDCFGFPYAFLHNFQPNAIEKPQGYSQNQAQGYEQTYLQTYTEPGKKPHIIMIMCEAFTDLPNDEAFTYTPEENPIAFYNELAKDEQTLSGHMVVSNTGAGTANTEFDVLTGMMTNRIAPNTTSAFRAVRRNTDSIPRALESVGYTSFFIHPGYNWFYNRESVYGYLGIEDQVFHAPDFTAEDKKGTWITDAAFLRELEEKIEAKASEGPVFAYGVTIQNHQAYTYDKYGYVPETVSTGRTLSPEAQELVSVYFEGLRDSDAMLKELVSHLEASDEPFILVFFGDHQPNLGGDYKGYRELGIYPDSLDTAPDRLSLYTVPFLIWGNSAFHENGDFSAIRQDLGEDPVISSHYLGALTCRAAGFAGLDGYIDYINDLCVELPVCSVYGYRTADGTWLEELSGRLLEQEELRHRWQYYRMKHQKLN